MTLQELCSIRPMALRAAQQDNVFKTRIADRIVIVFHSWLQMFILRQRVLVFTV